MAREMDLQAASGVHWSKAKIVAETSHRGRQIGVLRARKKDEAHLLGFVLCQISEGKRFEGTVTLYKSPKGGKLIGYFFGSPRAVYRLQQEPFTGDWKDVLALVKRILDYDYRFPPDLGMTEQ